MDIYIYIKKKIWISSFIFFYVIVFYPKITNLEMNYEF